MPSILGVALTMRHEPHSTLMQTREPTFIKAQKWPGHAHIQILKSVCAYLCQLLAMPIYCCLLQLISHIIFATQQLIQLVSRDLSHLTLVFNLNCYLHMD